MYASVLPYAVDSSGTVWVLLGQERHAPGRSASDLWSDFGGMSEQGETLREAAARECFEESMGMLGTADEILQNLCEQQSFAAVGPKGGRHYMMRVNFDLNVPLYFARFYHYARQSALLQTLTEPNNNDGLFEKQAVVWVRLAGLLNSYSKMNLRWFFRKTLEAQAENTSSFLRHFLAQLQQQ